MTHEQNLQDKIKQYWNIAQLCKPNKQKVTFFDENQEAFNLDPDDGEDAKNQYWEQNGMDDDDIEELSKFRDVEFGTLTCPLWPSKVSE